MINISQLLITHCGTARLLVFVQFDIDTFTLYMYVVLHVHHLESFESYKKYVYKSRCRAPLRQHSTAASQRRVQALGDVDSWARVKLRFTMLLMCSGKICIFSFTLNAHKVDAFSWWYIPRSTDYGRPMKPFSSISQTFRPIGPIGFEVLGVFSAELWEPFLALRVYNLLSIINSFFL